ncbi:HDOD domain-containing protein [Pseudoduganella sp. SL102]|uniref:HDOD domain-containing protein n=1 Tax=Pseudoduganella albidiflava TaxID=321983 RepID=A0A411WSR2_9BURK|nr:MULTISPECIES: HDOD domain-containing protein [Pseudoduganella]QBH99681.1 HDOD domain-containing protein [Pseudoduganella albidiflava]WBS02330.1 HDOD domain-containing protein [Pseudoduganella sp. SL102]GGY46841.1 HDOD domain-containing protein [Pseudoduganella albidiflava]
MTATTTPAREAAVEDALLRSIRIPPRPSLLVDLQAELADDDPSPRRIARIIGNDVGMSGALLKLANSPFFGAARKAKSVEQAINFLGINQCAALLTGLLARQAIDGGSGALNQFWDTSARRAESLVFIARRLRIAPADIAHTFGLFCDIGVPLLMDRFAGYADTLAIAGRDTLRRFTDVEDALHSTNHAAIGCLLARNWGLSPDVSWAILHHHDYAVLDDDATDDAIRSLVAASVLAERGIARYHGNRDSLEWEKGGEPACRHLGLDAGEAEDLLEELHDTFHIDH